MKSKNKGGRPTVEESQKRTHAINIRLNLQECKLEDLTIELATIGGEIVQLTNEFREKWFHKL